MSRKSLFNIGAGALMILSALLLYCIPMWFHVFQANTMSLLNIVLIGLAGLIFLLNAFLPNLIPNVILGVLFVGLALLSLRDTINSFMYFTDAFQFNLQNGFFISSLANLLYNVMQLFAFGGMAILVIFKDNFGHLFFAPAVAAAVSAVIILIYSFGIFFGNFHFPGFSILVLRIIDFLLAGALFAGGMATVED